MKNGLWIRWIGALCVFLISIVSANLACANLQDLLLLDRISTNSAPTEWICENFVQSPRELAYCHSLLNMTFFVSSTDSHTQDIRWMQALSEYVTLVNESVPPEDAAGRVISHNVWLRDGLLYKPGMQAAYDATLRMSPYGYQSFARLVSTLFAQKHDDISTMIVLADNYFFEFQFMQSTGVETTTTAGTKFIWEAGNEMILYHRYLLNGGYQDWNMVTEKVHSDGQWVCVVEDCSDLLLVVHPGFEQGGAQGEQKLSQRWRMMLHSALDQTQQYALFVVGSESEVKALEKNMVHERAYEKVGAVCGEGIHLPLLEGKRDQYLYRCGVIFERKPFE